LAEASERRFRLGISGEPTSSRLLETLQDCGKMRGINRLRLPVSFLEKLGHE
jgi:hypothetical protein